MAAFYFLAGINHFRDPDFYLPLIPDYFVFKEEINALSGLIEVVFGVLLCFESTRKMAAYGIVMMLAAFIPSHVYFIQIGSCVENGLCVPEWVGWARLLIIHPILIAWAWWHSSSEEKKASEAEERPLYKELPIIHEMEPDHGRFYIKNASGEELAEMTYRRAENRMVIQHTHVAESLRGKGVASALVKKAVDYGRAHQTTIVPVCRFAKAVLEKRKDWQDVL